MAYRIGCGGIAGEREGLRAEAAEISSRRGQLAHGSFIHALPRKMLKAGEFAQISASERSRTFQIQAP
jgi:hypothetical protein